MQTVNVGWLYPDLLNLHGERGSVQSLEYIGKKMGICVNIQRIEDPQDDIPFTDLDMLILLPGEIARFRLLADGLNRQRDALTAFIENGGYVLAMGTTGLLFGNSVTREDGSVVEGLGYLDMTATERKYVWGDDLHMKIIGSSMELIGSQVQMADVQAKQPFAETLYGRGNHADGTEGARYKNLIYTGCLGPMLVKNPWFGADILKNIIMNKYGQETSVPQFPKAEESMRSTLKFIAEKPEK